MYMHVTLCACGAHLMQLEVEATGIADRFAIVVTSPQCRGLRGTVGTGQSCSPRTLQATIDVIMTREIINNITIHTSVGIFNRFSTVIASDHRVMIKMMSAVALCLD